MARIAYVNGRYLPLPRATINVEDRGYQFADGVYEVYEVHGSRLIDESRHFARLTRSLAALRIEIPMTATALGAVLREVVRRNLIDHGIAYLQITRGVARRDHAFPAAIVPPAIVITARRLDTAAADSRATQGIAVITVPDDRWRRVDIKSVSLLPNVLAKQAASEAGASEAWLVDRDGFVTEGSSSNAWIVTAGGELVTAPSDQSILRGITRDVLLAVAAGQGIRVVERRFSRQEALDAAEAFITSATSLVTPVVRIDGRPIGGGAPGKMATGLRQSLRSQALSAPEWSTPVAPSFDFG